MIKFSTVENLSKLESFYIEDTVLNINLAFYKVGFIVICQYTQSKTSKSIPSLTKINGILPANFRPNSHITNMFGALESPANTELQIKPNGEIFIKRNAGIFAFGIIPYINI